MRASVRIAWRAAAAIAFGATAALAVTLTRGAPLHAALTSARHTSPARHAQSGTPECAASGLHISIDSAGAPAAATRVSPGMRRLTVRFPVDFTNVSSAPCTLRGYPEVSAYRGAGTQVGNVAGLDTSMSARLIVLAPGATAHAAVVDSVSSGRCRPVAATGLRVIAPGLSVPRYVRHTVAACSASGRKAPVFLHVRALQTGTGVTAARNSEQPRSKLT